MDRYPSVVRHSSGLASRPSVGKCELQVSESSEDEDYGSHSIMREEFHDCCVMHRWIRRSHPIVGKRKHEEEAAGENVGAITIEWL